MQARRHRRVVRAVELSVVVEPSRSWRPHRVTTRLSTSAVKQLVDEYLSGRSVADLAVAHGIGEATARDRLPRLVLPSEAHGASQPRRLRSSTTSVDKATASAQSLGGLA